MARWWIVCLVLFNGLLSATSFPTEQKNGEGDEGVQQPQLEFGKLLPKVIDFLQDDPNRIYYYKDFLVFDVKKKEDSINVQLQVKIICVKEEQCADTAYLICNASLPEHGNTYIFDGSVNCDPVVIKAADLSTSTGAPIAVIEPLCSEQQKQEPVELSHEITSQISGEQFIATPQHHEQQSDSFSHLTVPFCTGCLEPVNPTAEGVGELVRSALLHLEADSKSKHDLVRVVKVERQIVAGVKYSVLLEVKEGANGACKDGGMNVQEDDTSTCQEIDAGGQKSKYCKIDFINMPWIDKTKRIISNNCTVSQTYPPEELSSNSDDMDNEIDVNIPYRPQKSPSQEASDNHKPTNPNYDKMAESGSLDDETNTETETLMTPERLAFLESQIIMEQFTPETRTTEEMPKVQQTTVDNTQMAVDDIPSIFMMDEPAGKLTNEEIVTQEIAMDIKVSKRQSKIPVEEQIPAVGENSSSSEEEATRARKVMKNDSSESQESSEEAQRQKVKRYIITDSSEESHESAEDHHKHKRDLRPSSVQKVIPLHRVTLQSEKSTFIETHYRSNCHHLLKEVTLQSSSSKSNTNTIFELPPQLDSRLIGALNKFASDRNEVLLMEDLESFQQEKPLKFNIFVGVYKCAKDVPSDFYQNLNCAPDFSEKLRDEMVTLAVLDNGVSIQATYDWNTCRQTYPRLSVTHIPSIARTRQPRGIPGGQSSISVDDEHILSLVSSTLTQLDAESAHDTKYKVLEVIEASRQVVAGSLYRIKVKIAPSDCLKNKDVDPQNCGDLKEAAPIICELKIWDRPWLPNGRETNITCTEAGKNSRSQTHHFRSKREISYQSDYQHLLVNIRQMQTKHISNRLRFTQFKILYNRKYADATETAKRARTFARNMARLRREQNRLKELGHDDDATYGPSKFADIEPEEFKRTYLGLNPSASSSNSIPLPKAPIPIHSAIPDAIDWRTEGVVTPVKNQGACGSCWAFSVTGNIEGQYAMKHKELLQFSEQELVDCDKTDNGCGGGYMTDAYTAIEDLGGLELESDYPYDAQDEQCHFNKSLVRVQVVNALNISQDEGDMAKWLVQNGPISIGINANAMQFYMGGVSHPWKTLCDPLNLDHGVLIVGFGVSTNSFVSKSKPFWTVKNSWGKHWGEQGYYRVYRGDGTCGVNLMASSALVD